MSLKDFQKKFWALPSLNKKVKSSFEERARLAFKETLNSLIKELKDHPVSVELENRTSPSRFLPGYRGSGSLFAFMGFRDGDNPVRNLETFLRTFCNYKVSKNPIKIILKSRVSLIIPNKSDLRRAGFVLPWENGKSWPEHIEDGDINGLDFFLAKNSAISRSKEGIQSNHKLRNARFQGIPYLSPIFENARRRFFQSLQ